MVSNIPSPIVIFFWTILGILSVASLLGNGFITVVNVHQWLQNGKMSPCDFLLTTLSTTRFLLQLISMWGYPVYFNVPLSTVYFYTLDVMNVTWLLFHVVNLWCATWLSIFYCVKVANFSNPFFFWLKTRINLFLLRLLGMSIIISMLCTLPALVNHFGNIKWSDPIGIQPFNNSLYAKGIFSTFLLCFNPINFSLNILASILLLTSLWRHTRNLRKSGTAVEDFSTHVHIKVIKSVLFYLFFYILYSTGLVLASSSIFEFGRSERLVNEILLSAMSSAHSIILILNNPKLKKASTHIVKMRYRAS